MGMEAIADATYTCTRHNPVTRNGKNAHVWEYQSVHILEGHLHAAVLQRELEGQVQVFQLLRLELGVCLELVREVCLRQHLSETSERSAAGELQQYPGS